MFLVRFNTKTYQFLSKEDALGFAKTWNLQVEELLDESAPRLMVSYSSHALDTIANLRTHEAIVDLIKTYDLEWILSAHSETEY